MLPLGAFAVALLLNGAQILLPAPAFVDHGRTWAPARAVFERLGDRVRWEPAQQAMIVHRDGHTAAFPLGVAPLLDGQPLPVDASARRVQGTVYVPLVALRALGLRVQWQPDGKRVLLQAPVAGRTATLAAILADPLAWDGQEVTLSGEYCGWDADPFYFATRLGPPVNSGDFVLHNADGSLYCSPAHAAAAAAVPAAPSLARLTPTLPPLTPYAALGQRFAVTGTVKLTDKSVPYLLFSHLARPEGLAGVTCRLTLQKQQYRPCEAVRYDLLLANPQATRVVLGEQSEWLVSIAAPGGNIYVIKQSFPWQTKERGALAAGEQMTLQGVWRVPADAEAGTHALTARLSDDIGTYRGCFTVQPQREGATDGATLGARGD